MHFPLFVGVLCLSVLLCITFVHSSLAILLKRKRKLVALTLLPYRWIVSIHVMWLFLKVPYVGLQCVIVVFLDHFSSVFLLSLSVLIIILIDLLQECSYCPLLAIGVRLIHAVPWNDLLRIKNNSIWGSIENVFI